MRKKRKINCIVEGEPVTIIKGDNHYSATIHSSCIEFLESRYMKYKQGHGLFFVMKIHLN